MYPSIKPSTIKKAIKLIAATKKTINCCLELICFIISSPLTSFVGEYYEYNGGKKEEQGLAIGGYELAFLSNQVSSYFFEKFKVIINPTTYHGIYRYEGLVVFK